VFGDRRPELRLDHRARHAGLDRGEEFGHGRWALLRATNLECGRECR
jgi:hypothetical protein